MLIVDLLLVIITSGYLVDFYGTVCTVTILTTIQEERKLLKVIRKKNLFGWEIYCVETVCRLGS